MHVRSRQKSGDCVLHGMSTKPHAECVCAEILSSEEDNEKGGMEHPKTWTPALPLGWPGFAHSPYTAQSPGRVEQRLEVVCIYLSLNVFGFENRLRVAHSLGRPG